MNLIFLDFDDVLTNLMASHNKNILRQTIKKETSLKYRYREQSPEAIDYFINKKASEIDPNNFYNFNNIINATDAKIVICSTWRKSYPFVHDDPNIVIERFNKLFSILGYPHLRVIGFTDDFSIRGIEVASFLTEFSRTNKIDNYIILDDGSDFILKELNKTEFEEINFFNGIKIDYNEYKTMCSENPSFWQHQKLLRVNPMLGLSQMDALTAIEELNPEHYLSHLLKTYDKFLPHYKLNNSSKDLIKSTKEKKIKIK